MTQPASVLVIGNAGVGKFSLVRALRASSDIKTKDGAYQLTLDTKYYTADVLLHCVGPEHNPETAFEALVLVFDASQPGTFEAVRSWSDVHSISSAEVKLVVANKMDQLQRAGKQLPQPWLDDVMSWCCDNAYEFIEAAAGESSIDEQLHLDTEQGVARVLAALQAHMWPGLQRKGWTSDCHSDRSGSVALVSSSWRSTHQDEDSVSSQGQTTEAATGGPASVRARLAALPDAERRVAAAELALQFAVMLGLDGDDDDSSCDGNG
eukprot:gene11941-12084_t